MGSCCRPRQVCVIGAGMSGLAAARELRREGHAVTVMEQSGDVGGQWLYDPRTDADDQLGAKAPVKVHSSMYASERVISPRECMGFSDFQFVPRSGAGAGAAGDLDARRFPGHREVYCYLKDFCAAFGLADAIRLNTRVVRVAMAPPPSPNSDVQWIVKSVHVEPDGGEGEDEADEEVFDAVVVANGHYSQPRLLSGIDGMDVWRRRQLHSHSYRAPEPFRGEAVVVVGGGDSGMDIAAELCGVAREVHLAARSVEPPAPPPMLAKIAANRAGNGGGINLHPPVHRLCEDGAVVFADGGVVAAVDTVIYCTGYTYSFPFLDTGGLVTVGGDNRVGPLYEHTFPPALAPSLSFVGVPMRVFAPWIFEAQARWVALVLSGKAALPPAEDMLRAVHDDYRARELAGVPTNHTHDIPAVNRSEIWEFVYRNSDLPRMEEWKAELFWSGFKNAQEDRDTYRDREDEDSEERSARACGDGAAWPVLSTKLPSLLVLLAMVVSDAAHACRCSHCFQWLVRWMPWFVANCGH